MDQELRSKAEELAKLPYTIEIVPDSTTDGEPAFAAFVLELEGCIGQGATLEEAEMDVRAAMVDFIESLLEDGLSIPHPHQLPSTTSTSGTLMLAELAQRHDQVNLEESTRRHVQRLAFIPVKV